jgi:hypothetical protein
MEGPPFTKGKDIDSNRGIALSMKMGSLDFGLVPKSSLRRQFPESVQFHTPKPDSSPNENSKNRERSGPANHASLGGSPAAFGEDDALAQSDSAFTFGVCPLPSIRRK